MIEVRKVKMLRPDPIVRLIVAKVCKRCNHCTNRGCAYDEYEKLARVGEFGEPVHGLIYDKILHSMYCYVSAKSTLFTETKGPIAVDSPLILTYLTPSPSRPVA
jgi:hypothetical protein